MSTAEQWRQEAQAEADDMLLGQTIDAVEVETHYDRTHGLILTFSSGERVRISYFAAHAEDAGLTIEEAS